jgi:hypothetical protein
MQRSILNFSAFMCFAIAGFAGRNVLATPITRSAFQNPTILNFDEFSTSVNLSPGSIQPFAGLGVTFHARISQVGTFPAPFTSPGHLGSGFSTGLNYVVRANFSVPVHRVGADFFGSSNNLFYIRIFDEQLNLLEEFSDRVRTGYYTISSPGFIGFESTRNIGRIDFVVDSASGLTTFPRVDNFTFERAFATIPEPTSLLTWCGLIVIAAFRFRDRGLDRIRTSTTTKVVGTL